MRTDDLQDSSSSAGPTNASKPILDRILDLLSEDQPVRRGYGVFILSLAAPYIEGLMATPAQRTFWYYMQHYWINGKSCIQGFCYSTSAVDGSLKQGWWRFRHTRVKKLFESIFEKNRVEGLWQELLDILATYEDPYLAKRDDWEKLGRLTDFTQALMHEGQDQDMSLEALFWSIREPVLRKLALTALYLNMGNQAARLLTQATDDKEPEVKTFAVRFLDKLQDERKLYL